MDDGCSQQGLLAVFVSAMSFRLLYVLVHPLSRLLFGTYYTALTPTKRLLWKNHSLSLVHAILCSVIGIYCLVHFPEIRHDMIRAHNPLIRTLLWISAGYFYSNLFDMIWHRLFLNKVDLWVHHTMVIICFTLSIYSCSYIAYVTATLVTELNGFFACVHSLLRTVRDDGDHWMIHWNRALLLGTYLPFRVLPGCWLVYRVCADVGRFDSPLIFLLALSGTVALNVLNIKVLVDLYRAETDTGSGGGAERRKIE